jgi:hypothetical protein
LEGFFDLVTGRGDLGQAALSVLEVASPTITDPLVELAANKKYNDAPIWPASYGTVQSKPSSENYFKTVAPHWKAVARWLNELGGGNEQRAGNIKGFTTSFNPEAMEYVWDYLTGGPGTFVGDLIKGGSSALNAEWEGLLKLPIVRQVVRGTSPWVARREADRYIQACRTVPFTPDQTRNFYIGAKRAFDVGAVDQKGYTVMVRTFENGQSKLRSAAAAYGYDPQMDADEARLELQRLEGSMDAYRQSRRSYEAQDARERITYIESLFGGRNNLLRQLTPEQRAMLTRGRKSAKKRALSRIEQEEM